MINQNEKPNLLAPALLLFSAIVGFALSNSGLNELYQNILLTKVDLVVGETVIIKKSFLLLVNDGLMAIFFLFIGLELKREVIVGELSNAKQAMLPIFAAIGGMVVPAITYLAINPAGDAASGWGVPMATDIAFALGILAVLGSRAPASLKVLLTAIAIVDDLGAILVIALFYTASVDFYSLMIAFGFFFCCVGANALGVMRISIYMLLGVPLWYFMLKSGVHATIAGVLLAMTIPLAKRSESTAKLLSNILYNKASLLDSPAVFLEKSLYKWVGLLIVPIFAFCNAGVTLSEISIGGAAIGIVLGLVVGKPLGIVGFSYLATSLKLTDLPRGVSWTQITGLGFLAGVGFTMALFISSLAFSGAGLASESKFAILVASLIAGTLGTILISKNQTKSEI